VSDRRRERLTTTSTGPVRTLDLGRGSSIQGASQGETTLDLSDPPRQPRSPHPTDEDGAKVVTRDAKEVSDAVFDRLSAEFGDRIDADTIRRVAIQEIALFENAKVRTFVPLIAWRLARFRLLEGSSPRRHRRSAT
jgi:hypothetical protein